MFLSYLALTILIVVIIAVVYLFIWIHDIPYRLAKKRNHPNLHAIHVACWLSLFTLHALWPFVFLWAIIPKPRFEVIVVREEGVDVPAEGKKSVDSADPVALRQAIRDLQARLDSLEKRAVAGGKS
ncbi:MAG: DUF3302 domain-containing protein [Phycisphaerales bacterium]|nr:DUF3302 domain-containing protein [Phycisphaerales bacterium]